MGNRMFRYDEDLTEFIFAHLKARLRWDPVPLDRPGHKDELEAVLAGLMTKGGTDPHHVMALFDEQLASAIISVDSPRFLSFIPAAPTKAALLFDMVVSAGSLQGTTWLESAGAIAAENQTLRLLADLAGLPPSAGGCFVSGGSAGNLSALMVARDSAGLRRPAAGPAGRRLRVAVSEEAHSSITKALRVLGMDALVIPTVDDRLTGEALAAALEADGDVDTVIGVAATAGTTNAGLVDDLAGIAAVARRRNLWFHVDAAYGGAGLFAPSIRPLYRGIELADSYLVDPHKWLMAPYDSAALIYRDPALAKAVHTQDAPYLEIVHGDASDEWNPSDYAYHLTRRARGLPLWFSLAVNGTDAYTEAIEAVVSLTRQVADRIRVTPHVELLREPELSIVLFRRPGWLDRDYRAWSQRLLDEQIAFVTPTVWKSETVARLAFLHPDTDLDLVVQILDTMR